MRKAFTFLYEKIMNVFSGRGLERYRVLATLDNFVTSFLKSRLVTIDGHIIFLDPKDTLRLSLRGNYEPSETALVRRYVKQGDVVLDLGANIGYFTLLFARLVGERGKVYAFEPDPENFSLLKKNVAANRYHNVVLEQKAVSDGNGRLRLYLCDENRGDHRIHDPSGQRSSVGVEAVTLGSYFVNYHGRIDFVKMDVQGAEEAALRGMTSLLQKYPKLKIMMEFWPLALKQAGYDPRGCLDILRKQGFTFYSVDKRMGVVEGKTVDELLLRYTPKKQNSVNLLCMRE